MQNIQRLLIWSAFAFSFLKINAQSTCQYLAYENFAAVANTPLHGSSSGTGWAAAWNVQSGNTVIPGYALQANSLSYSTLQTTAMSAVGGYVYLTAGRRLNTNDNGPFSAYVANSQNGIGTETGGELWVSGLLRKEVNNGENVFFAFHDNNVDWCESCTSNKLSFGYFGAASDVNGIKMWSVRIGNSVYPTNEPVIIGTAAFFAAKITFTPTGTNIDCYVNPTSLGNSLPSSATLSQSTTTNLIIRNLALYLGNSTGNGSVDEIRMATSYACVAPDNTVLVDLPPIAAFTISANSGTTPVNIQLDATASTDPENLPLTYSWNFGDGSAPLIGQTLVNHAFIPIGVLQISLTVTDVGGQSHTTYQDLTVYDSTGTYPCNNTFSLLHEASCGQSDGILRVNNPPSTFSLFNSANANMPLASGNQFQNLAAGIYTYIADGGIGGCKDTFQLHIPTDSSTCAGWSPSDCNMDIGINLSGLADWNYERPFRNLFLQVRREMEAFDLGCNCWSNGMAGEIQTDSNGYPLQIPQATTASPTTYVRMVMSTGNATLQQGNTYVLLYDGVGDIQIQGGATEISDTLNRIEFYVTATGNIWFNLMESQAGNPVRNIRMLRLSDEFATDLNTQPFYSGFLEKIAPFHSIRFMDWGMTNASPHIEWQNRAKVTQKTYAGEKGVPYEIMIKLANIAHKNVWICVPHAADDNYIAQMAKLFRDSLNPSLQVYLEYSNEVWNWMFEQAHYNDNNKPSNLNYAEAYAEKARKVFRIWRNTFGIQPNRVQRVLGLQGGYNWLNEFIVSQLKQEEWDLAAPTFYYGLNHGSTGNPVLNASSTPLEVLQNSYNSYLSFAPLVHQDYRNAHLFGKEVVNYEGGQHFTNFTQPPYLQAMYDAQLLPQMYNLYDMVLDSIRLWGSKMAMAFTLAGPRESIYGSWGHLEDIDQDTIAQPAPKFQALIDNMANKPIPVIGGDIWSGNNVDISHFYVQNPTGVGYNYQWTFSNQAFIIGNPNSSQVEVSWSLTNFTDTAFVSLTVIDNNGCAATTTVYLPLFLVMKVAENANSFFSLYPNPAEENFVIHLKDNLHKQEKAYLWDIMGKQVKEISLTGEITTVNVNNILSGVYILKLGNESKKLVIK